MVNFTYDWMDKMNDNIKVVINFHFNKEDDKKKKKVGEIYGIVILYIVFLVMKLFQLKV